MIFARNWVLQEFVRHLSKALISGSRVSSGTHDLKETKPTRVYLMVNEFIAMSQIFSSFGPFFSFMRRHLLRDLGKVILLSTVFPFGVGLF